MTQITGTINDFEQVWDALDLKFTKAGDTAGYIDFDTSALPAFQEGRLHWNANDKTLDLDLDAGSILQLGQELHVRCSNKSGAQINNGDVVYISGAQGDRPTIELADASSLSTSLTTVGVATQDIAINAIGYVTIRGLVRGLNTSAFIDGDAVWVSTTAGGMTATQPDCPNVSYLLGIIVRSNAADGILLVNPQLVKTGVSMPYGSMYIDNGAQVVTITVIDTPAELAAGVSQGELWRMTFQNASELVAQVAGVYAASWQVSFTAESANQEIEGFFMVNGVRTAQSTAHRKIGTGTDTGSMSGTALLNLAVNDVVSIGFSNGSSTANVIVNHCNVALHKI